MRCGPVRPDFARWRETLQPLWEGTHRPLHHAWVLAERSGLQWGVNRAQLHRELCELMKWLTHIEPKYAQLQQTARALCPARRKNRVQGRASRRQQRLIWALLFPKRQVHLWERRQWRHGVIKYPAPGTCQEVATPEPSTWTLTAGLQNLKTWPLCCAASWSIHEI